jgi:hypothetical protein
MSSSEYAKGIIIGGIVGGGIQGTSALMNGRTFWTGEIPNTGINPTAPVVNYQRPTGDTEIKLPNDGRTALKELPSSGPSTIKEFHVRQLYLKELENPHMFSNAHIKDGILDAIGSEQMDGFDDVAKLVIDADRAGSLVEGSNQIRYISNAMNVEVRVFIQNGTVMRLDAFVMQGVNPRNMGNVINWP